MNNDISSIIIGLGLSTAVFSFKSGVGQYYYLAAESNRKKKLWFLMLSALAYFMVFIISFLLLSKTDILRFINGNNTVNLFLKSGTYMHFLWAGILIICGFAILKSRPREIGTVGLKPTKSKGWLLLAIPCPVCASAIFLICLFLNNIFPDHTFLMVNATYGFFLIFTLLTISALLLFAAKTSATPESILGGLMLIIGAYFILILIVSPLFKELESVYRIAVYQSGKSVNKFISKNFMWTTVLLTSLILITGFICRLIKIKELKNAVIRSS